MSALGIPRPADRHRALADAQVTAEVFERLVMTGTDAGLWQSQQDLRKKAGYIAKATLPVQGTLFG